MDHPGGSITVSVSEAESDSAEIQVALTTTALRPYAAALEEAHHQPCYASFQDFHEVQLTLRVPRATQRQQSPPEGKSYGMRPASKC